MHHQNRRRYSRDFKIEALNQINESGKSIAQVARDLDISVHQLYGWKRELQKKQDKAFPGHSNKNAQDELKRLRKENQRLIEERDILKKSLIFFARDHKSDTDSSIGTKQSSE